ncbi:hypothetical protein ACIU4M_00665 [Bacillus altitudinis]|uniref:hypothetical protein n=1 Tax=Bacillus altitudinis TaxID=293387 RepID=UPI003899B969
MALSIVDIIKGISSGQVKDGDTFSNESGFKMIWKSGVLRWVVGGGYAGAPVSVTDEHIHSKFTLIERSNLVEVGFDAAMYILSKEKDIELRLAHRTYQMKSLYDFEDVIVSKENLADVYENGKFYKEEGDMQPPAQKVKHNEKLTHEDAFSIHHKYHVNKRSALSIAEEYGISDRMVYYILDGTHWLSAYQAFHTVEEQVH